MQIYYTVTYSLTVRRLRWVTLSHLTRVRWLKVTHRAKERSIFPVPCVITSGMKK